MEKKCEAQCGQCGRWSASLGATCWPDWVRSGEARVLVDGARLTITLSWHACRNDVILAEACRNDVEAYCKDVEPGVCGGDRVGRRVWELGQEGKASREEGLALRHDN